MNKKYLQVLEIVQDGPVTAADVADELGWKVNHASAHLNCLKEDGFIKVIKRISPTGIGRPMNLWATVNGEPA